MHIVISWYPDGSAPIPKVTPCETADGTINTTIQDAKLGMETTVYAVEDDGLLFRRISGPDLSK